MTRGLFLGFLVRCAGLAPLTKLLKLDFALHQLFVFARPIIGALALGTVEFY